MAIVWRSLLPRERKLFVALGVINVLNALVQSAGLFSVMPFVAVLTQPQKMREGFLGDLHRRMGEPSETNFIMVLGGATLLLLVLGNIFQYFSLLLHARFCAGRIVSFSQRILAGYISRPYEYFLSIRSSDIIQNMVTHLEGYVGGAVSQVLHIISQCIISCCIFGVMLIPNPVVAVVLAVVFGGLYGLIFYRIRQKLYSLGKITRDAYNARHKWVAELISGVKELIVLNRFDVFYKKFKEPLTAMHRSTINQFVWSSMPPLILQTFAFVSMIGLFLIYIGMNGDINTLLPTLALYMACTYKLMPSITALFKGAAKLKSSEYVAHLIWDLLPENHPAAQRWDQAEPSPEKLGKIDFVQTPEIQGENIAYRYPSGDADVLKGISFRIQAGTTTAIVGATGSGKSTLLDLLLGLLVPKSGNLHIGGLRLDSSSIRSWRSLIGYVPQHVYLSDDTIAKNIALGVADREIRMDQVREAAQAAQIDTFVKNELAQGYDTVVGERGIRLSGGQRQRLGIARAIYHDPQVIVLDEATSALDPITESAVLEALLKRGGNKTIIMVTHRISSARNCRHVIVLSNGKIVGTGEPSKLAEICPEFAELCAAAETSNL